MLKPYNQKSYASRPLTPLGDAFGLTSTPVSQVSSRQNSPPPLNPYMYQPAITLTHPNVFPKSSSNYAHAVSAGETIIEITQTFPVAPNQQSESSSPGDESLRRAAEEGKAIRDDINSGM
jgi:hypothetical protein